MTDGSTPRKCHYKLFVSLICLKTFFAMSSDQNTTQETVAIKHEPGASWKANEIHHLPENRLSVVGLFSVSDPVINIYSCDRL